MRGIILKTAYYITLGFFLVSAFSACVQPANLDDLLEEAKKIDWEGTDKEDEGNDDGAPDLVLVAWAEMTLLGKGDTVSLNPGGEVTIRVTIPGDFISIDWFYNGESLIDKNVEGNIVDGQVFVSQYTANASDPRFIPGMDHFISVITIANNNRPYSTFFVIQIVD